MSLSSLGSNFFDEVSSSKSPNDKLFCSSLIELLENDTDKSFSEFNNKFFSNYFLRSLDMEYSIV